MEASYTKALDKIEEFMQKSGIRNICSNFCIGRCCGHCYKSEKACHKNEGRRLACSFYICSELRQLLFTEYEDKVFGDINRIVSDKIRDSMPGYTVGYSSIYFTINSQSARDKFSIDLNVLNRLDEIDVNKALNKSTMLCNLHNNFCAGKKVRK